MKLQNRLKVTMPIQCTLCLLSYNTQYTCYHATQNILVTMQHALNILPF